MTAFFISMSKPILPCPTCRRPVDGNYCAHCGERRAEPGDHTVRRFIGHLLEAFTHADGKIFLSLRCLLTRPGLLTADYLRGRRQPYIPPLQLFLIGNLVFFLLHPFVGSNTLTTDLNSHLHYTWHRAAAQALVTPGSRRAASRPRLTPPASTPPRSRRPSPWRSSWCRFFPPR